LLSETKEQNFIPTVLKNAQVAPYEEVILAGPKAEVDVLDEKYGVLQTR